MSTSSEESLFTFFVSSCTSIAQWMYALHIILQCMGWLPSSNLMCVFTFIQWMYALASSEQSSCIIQWRKSNPWAAMSVQNNKAAFFLKKIIVGSHPLCLFVSCREPQTDCTGTRMICRNASWMHFTCLEQLDMSLHFIRHTALSEGFLKCIPFQNHDMKILTWVSNGHQIWVLYA